MLYLSNAPLNIKFIVNMENEDKFLCKKEKKRNNHEITHITSTINS